SGFSHETRESQTKTGRHCEQQHLPWLPVPGLPPFKVQRASIPETHKSLDRELKEFLRILTYELQSLMLEMPDISKFSKLRKVAHLNPIHSRMLSSKPDSVTPVIVPEIELKSEIVSDENVVPHAHAVPYQPGEHDGETDRNCEDY